ncbi:hypothetical protein EVAR_80828_1 [Eumeta japonica]|uniref:Uncharacterized protein n=1 Tax=Eumeta variegata TaxID=151549 RepID=A0A4C1WE47_EUMVA|nr:hypothetical protein EVAR_80828_1 [Eumeta japonica]
MEKGNCSTIMHVAEMATYRGANDRVNHQKEGGHRLFDNRNPRSYRCVVSFLDRNRAQFQQGDSFVLQILLYTGLVTILDGKED